MGKLHRGCWLAAAAAVLVHCSALAQGAGDYAGSPEAATASRMAGDGAGPQQLFAYLSKFESRYAGDPDYDMALARSAEASGHYATAQFARKRALRTRRVPESMSSDSAGFIEISGGYDSNANAGPELSTFLGIPVDQNSQEAASDFLGFGVGAAISKPAAEALSVLAGVEGAYRSYPQAAFVDERTVRGSLGIEYRPGRVTYTLIPRFAYRSVTGEANHRVGGIDGSVALPTGRMQVAAHAQYSQLRYQQDPSLQDVDTLLYGVSAQTTTSDLGVRIGAALSFGTERAAEAASPYGRSIAGASVSFTFGSTRTYLLELVGGLIASDYDGTFYGQERKDRHWQGEATYDWYPQRAQGWSVRTQLRYVDHPSSVALYDYHRYEAALMLRRALL